MTTSQTTREAAAVNAVARETLRRIAQERISPTPEAYARIYADVARTHPDHPRAASNPAASTAARELSATIARVVAQIDSHHAGITVTRKREGLKRALVPRAEEVESLRARLDRLVDSWAGPNAATGSDVSQFLGTDILGPQNPSATAVGVATHVAPVAAAPAPLSASQAFAVPTHLLASIHGAAGQPAPALRAAQADSLNDHAMSLRIAGLLALVLKNIEELTPESNLLSSQIEQIGRVLTTPLTEKKLDEAERCLRALIVRQGALKRSLDATKEAIRELAATLLERLGSLVSTTDSYSTKVVDMAERIANAEDLTQLSDLTQMLVTDTRLMASNIAAERAMLAAAQERATELQARTDALENELREASALVRTDPLTRAMNRRGFGDAFATEMTRANEDSPPTIALLDVDNFKLINESFGHAVGDEVLCKLVEVLHRCARPTDTVARYGGEEFAIIFPNKRPAEAEMAILKMQRELKEQIGDETSGHPRITFSAGIAQVEPGESLGDVMTRADRALRQAKIAGKNRVVAANLPATQSA